MRISAQTKCTLLPFKQRPVVSAQELRQKIGWGISTFHLPEAWKVTQGEGIVVAVLDSGACLDHPDLKANLLPGYNVLSPKRPPEDDCGHGTAVAGIICAENNKQGIVGVAPHCKVRPIKVLDEYGDGEISDVCTGMYWAIDQKVDFIVMSLGTVDPVRSLRRAVKVADKAGIPIFCAAGNMGRSESLLYPSNYPETISVGAIDKDMKRADFNNTGKNLDFMAPGVDILSTTLKNGYAIFSGSSMAGPYVGGLAALLKSYSKTKRPDLKLNCTNDYRQFFRMHTMNVVGAEYAGDKFYQGYGIITLDRYREQFKDRSVT